MSNPISYIKNAGGTINAAFVDQSTADRIDVLENAVMYKCVRLTQNTLPYEGRFVSDGRFIYGQNDWRSSDPIPVSEGTYYYYRGMGYKPSANADKYTVYNVAFFNDTFELVGFCAIDDVAYKVYDKRDIVPTGATYAIVCDNSASYSDGNAYFAYEAHDECSTVINLTENDVLSENYAISTNGQLFAYENTCIFTPIACRPGDKIEYTGVQTTNGASIAFFDDTGTVLGVVVNTNTSAASLNTKNAHVAGIAPDNAEYFVVTSYIPLTRNPRITITSGSTGTLLASQQSMRDMIIAELDLGDLLNAQFGWYTIDGVWHADAAGAWAQSDYIAVENTMALICALYAYTNIINNVHLCTVAWFDKDKQFIAGHAVEPVSSVNSLNGIEPQIVYAPSGATYFRLCYRVEEFNAMRYSVYTLTPRLFAHGYTPWTADVDALKKSIESSRLDLRDTFIVPAKYTGLKKRINVIGDSISQGSSCDETYNDSYVGILRQFMRAEYGGNLNYGFEPFPNTTELKVNKTMLYDFSSQQFTRTWNGADCYGNDTYTAATGASSPALKFKVRQQFAYMKVSYLQDSNQGSFKLQAAGDTIATVSCSGSKKTCMMTDSFDISKYPVGTQFTIAADTSAGPVSISGIELGDNAEWVTFNNYGRAGIAPMGITGNLFEREADADLVIYALGVNSNIVNLNSAIAEIKSTLLASSADLIILDLCMIAKNQTSGVVIDNREKKTVLKDFANELKAIYIDAFSFIPKESSGYADPAFMYDQVHPNDLGHELIASAIAKTLRLACTSKNMALDILNLRYK